MVIEYHNKNDEDKNDLKAAKENHNQRLNDLENQLELLKKMGAPSGGSSDGLLDVLNDITDKLRKELQDKLDDLSKRIEEVDKDSKDRDATQEDRMKNMLDIQNDNIKRLDDLDLQCGALSDEKADKNDFLNEIRRLEDIIEGLGSGKPVEIRAASPKGPKVTEDDIDKWNKAAKIADQNAELLEKYGKSLGLIDSLKDRLDKVEASLANFVTQDQFKPVALAVKRLEQRADEVDEEIRKLWDAIKKIQYELANAKYPSIDEFNLLRSRVDKLENMLGNLNKSLADMQKKLKGNLGGGADQGMVDRLIDELNKLRQEFEEHRDHANGNIQNINNILPTKADKQDLIDLQNSILDKLRDMIQQILNQFANKDDVMKRFAQLSKKIKEIMELLNRQGGGHEEDAMFSKRHLGPNACASCEKDLVNMYG